jgi:nitrate/TMAO reductase-like tetraheme cytochrome c subunit
MQSAWTGKRALRTRGSSLLAIPLVVALILFAGGEAPAEGDAPAEAETPAVVAPNFCVECHGNPDFLVTAKKLYDYYQEWEISVHRQEDVSCEDCHGGNSETRDKKRAHGTEVSGGLAVGSAVSFQNIPSTCGECHDDIYEGYRQSNHFAHLRKKKQEKQGPNCVTCHGSINATVLNVNTVQAVCQRCHNEETKNHPELPAKANDILDRFLSINRYYRYIGIRGDPTDTQAFFAVMDQRIRELSVLWHTFDLPTIDKETRFILDLLKAKRAEVRNLQRTEQP